MAAEPVPAAKRAEDQAARYRAASDAIRSRTDLTAKGLATVGTAAVTAIGYAKLADIFPYGGPSLAVVGLALGVPAMVVAVGLLLRRFNSVGEAVVTTADAEQTFEFNDGFDDKDKRLVRKIYGRMASLNRVDSLAAYLQRGRRFERIADRLDETAAAPLRARAEVIMAEVLATQDRVSALILKKRAKEALYGFPTLAWIGLFIAGWYLTALSADAMQSERSDKIDVVKACAEARQQAKVVESELPTICGDVPKAKEEAAKPSAARAAATAVAEMAKARAGCLEQAEEAKQDASVCAPLDRALAAAVGG